MIIINIMAWENQIWENKLGRIVVGRKLTSPKVPKLGKSESGLMAEKIKLNYYGT